MHIKRVIPLFPWAPAGALLPASKVMGAVVASLHYFKQVRVLELRWHHCTPLQCCSTAHKHHRARLQPHTCSRQGTMQWVCKFHRVELRSTAHQNGLDSRRMEAWAFQAHSEALGTLLGG